MKSDHILLRKTKNGKERKVPITAMLYEALSGLAERFGTEGRVIPRSGQTVWGWCRDAGRDAGVPGVHPHLFRSSAATHMLNNGAPVHAVKDLLGHQSIKTTNGYAATQFEDVRAAADKLRPPTPAPADPY